MESLLCNEVWEMSPIAAVDNNNNKMHAMNEDNDSSFKNHAEEEDFDKTFGMFLEKEASYMPEKGYVNYLKSDDFINNARFRSICWLIKSQKRLNLSLGTIFYAANYLDLFISINQCEGWKCWMFELLCVACLSVATKFNETIFPSLSEFQMEGIEHLFESSLIQRMEVKLLKDLGWRLSSITPYSYIEMLIPSVSLEKNLSEDLTERVNEMLLCALLDLKFFEFRPCVIAISVARHIFEEISSANCANLAHFASLIPRDHMDDITKCQKMMEKQQTDNLLTYCNNYYCPSSPVTVLTEEQFNHCLFKTLLQEDVTIGEVVPTVGSSKRRKIDKE